MSSRKIYQEGVTQTRVLHVKHDRLFQRARGDQSSPCSAQPVAPFWSPDRLYRMSPKSEDVLTLTES